MQKRQADMEEAYAAQVRPPRFARFVAFRPASGTPNPTVAFVPDPTPPSAVGRRQRLAPPQLRPARQRRRRRQGQPRDRGAPERHRQGTRRHGSRQTRSFAPSRSRTAAEPSTRPFFYHSRILSSRREALTPLSPPLDTPERRPSDLQEDRGGRGRELRVRSRVRVPRGVHASDVRVPPRPPGRR